jgi:hypothetical protein
MHSHDTASDTNAQLQFVYNAQLFSAIGFHELVQVPQLRLFKNKDRPGLLLSFRYFPANTLKLYYIWVASD